MKKSELIETLKAMRDNKKHISRRALEQGNEKMHDEYLVEWMTIEKVIDMMTDRAYAERLREIYVEEK